MKLCEHARSGKMVKTNRQTLIFRNVKAFYASSLPRVHSVRVIALTVQEKGGLMRGWSRKFRGWQMRSVLAEAVEPRWLLSTFTVNTTSDVSNPSDGLTTL